MAEKSLFSRKLAHVGMVVRDMHKTVKRLELLGMGPFKPYDFSSLSPLVGKCLFRGMPYEGTSKLLVGKIGDVTVELFQPIEGESPFKEFLDRKGEGVHHLAFTVDDLDREVARFTDQGVNILHSARQENGGGAIYLEIGVPDFNIELEQLY